MATVIDALVITLGLDVTGFKKSLGEVQEGLKKTRQETDRHTKEMEARAKSLAGAFSKVQSEVLGMLTAALAAGGVGQFVAKITEGDAATGRLATNLGIATKNLSAWEGMAAKFGGSAEDIDSAFRSAFKLAQDINMGRGLPGSLSFLFGKAGMDLAEFVQLARSGDVENMLKMLQKAVTLSPDKGMAMNLLQQAGFSEQTFNVFREVNDQLDRQLQLQEKLNVVNQRDAELAIERQQAWSKLGDALTSVGRSALNSPFVINLLNYLGQKPKGIGDVLTFSPGKLLDMFSSHSDGASPTQNSAPVSRDQWLGSLESKWGLPKGLLSEVIRQEGWKGKDSKAGAQGPMQFMPGTGAAYGLSTRADREDFNKSTEAGAHYLHDLLIQYGGNLQAALRAYNGGTGGVAGRFPESVNYANSIMGRMAKAGNSIEVHIENQTITTQATDAKGIARDFAGSVRDSYAFAAHSSVGAQ